MGSSFFGKLKMGSDRRNNSSASSSSGSSRRSKKGHVDNKPKQPQRGLGVAQLEQLRLHEEMERCSYNNPNSSLHTQPPFIPSNFTPQDVRVQQLPYSPSTTSSSSIAYAFQHNIAMGRSEYESANICWRQSDMNMLETPQYGHPSMDRQFIDLTDEDYQQGNSRRHKNISDSTFWSGSLNSSDDQEVDLELRL